MTFLGRCKDFFGVKPGQSLQEFAQELKKLTEKDKADLVRYFNEAGLPTDPATAPQDGK